MGRYEWRSAQAAFWGKLRRAVRIRARCRLSILHYQTSCDLDQRLLLLSGGVLGEDKEHPILGGGPEPAGLS